MKRIIAMLLVLVGAAGCGKRSPQAEKLNQVATLPQTNTTLSGQATGDVVEQFLRATPSNPGPFVIITNDLTHYPK